MEEDKIEITMNTADGANKCMLHIQQTTDCLTHIYHAINQDNNSIQRPLPTNSLPIIVDTKKAPPRLEEQRLITLNWTLTKAFEEFINGLTKCLKENYRLLYIYSLSLEPKYSKTREQFEEEFQKLNEKLEKAHFPEFIELIEKRLNRQLFLREEIITLNQIRNCLVHRHGIVSEKDIKNSPTGDLRLKWSSLRFFTNKDGRESEITYDFRKDGVQIPGFTIKQIKNEKIFKLGDNVTVDIEEFNGISFTCLTFVLELFRALPVPTT